MKCGVVDRFLFGLVGWLDWFEDKQRGRSCEKTALIVMEPTSFSKN